MPPRVIDASVALKWLLPETDSPAALALIEQHRLLAPDLLLVECANVLWARVRRGDLVPVDAKAALADLEAVPVAYTADRELVAAAQSLAVDLNHPVYDCLYLALGLRLAAPVVTADRRFADTVHRHPFLANRVERLDKGDVLSH